MKAPWPSLTLGELTESTRPICYGVLKPGPYVHDGIPLIRIVDIKQDTLDLSAVHRISRDLDSEFARSRLSGGEVLLSIQGTIGRVAICPSSLAGANISRTIAVIQPDERVLPEFLRLYLMNLASMNRFEVTGTTRDSLNISTIREMTVPVPPLDEQQRIVAILEEHLSRLDAAARALSRILLLVRSLRESILAAALSRKVARDGKDWRSATLADVATWSSGGTPSSSNKAFYGGEIPWVVIGDLTESLVEATEKTITEAGYEASAVKLLPRGTVMLAMYGASIGRTGRMATEMTTNQAIACAVVDESVLDPEFLLLFLQSQRRLFVAAGRGGAQPNISQRIVKAWPIRFPELEEQRRIIDTVNGALATVDRLQAEVLRTDVRVAALRRSLLASAFSGQLTREPISV